MSKPKAQEPEFRTVRLKVRTTTRTLLSKKVLREMIDRSNNLNRKKKTKGKA
jgi:hypothetical protein